jgi:phospholipase C
MEVSNMLHRAEATAACRRTLALLTTTLFLLQGSVALMRGEPNTSAPGLRHIKHIVVIYQENWSFDSLYGLFPGANGLRNLRPRR